VGISLAAVIVFYLVRVHPTDAETGEVRQRFVRHVLISAVILAIIIAPLVSFGIQALNTNKDKQVIASSLSEIFGRNDIFSTNIQVDRTTRAYSVRVILLQSPGTDQPKGTALDARLSNALGKTVHSQVLYFNSLQ
jgi:uncharacterized membrane protein